MANGALKVVCECRPWALWHVHNALRFPMSPQHQVHLHIPHLLLLWGDRRHHSGWNSVPQPQGKVPSALCMLRGPSFILAGIEVHCLYPGVMRFWDSSCTSSCTGPVAGTTSACRYVQQEWQSVSTLLYRLSINLVVPSEYLWAAQERTMF